MKRKVFIAAAAAAAIFAACCLNGCTSGQGIGYDGADFAADAVCSVGGETVKSAMLKGESRASIEIELKEETLVNTVVLREKGDNATFFRIYAWQDDAWVAVHGNDKIGSYRYCAFPDVLTKKLKIEVRARLSEKFEISEINVYRRTGSNAEFRVAGYMPAGGVDEFDAGMLDALTDLILFESCFFRENGALEYDAEKLGAFVAKARSVNPSVRIIAGIMNPVWTPEASRNERTVETFKYHMDAFVANVAAFVSEFGFDGVDFDWEYPENSSEWKLYGNMLLSVKKAIAPKRLSVAVWAGGVDWSDEVKRAVDSVNYMGYDAFDEDGYHSNFADTAVLGVNYLLDKGFTRRQICLGVPFYARPTDGDSIWVDYKTEADRLGRFENVARGEVGAMNWGVPDGEWQICYVPRYFNGYQMIYDKTAYAADNGLGGVMVWSLNSDLPYSDPRALLRAVDEGSRHA